ncbi:hypothetical protein AQUCO_04200104v1 [Aquilegia coerulea]|uniref:Uncharacterized protein n=1 Tax=Aquilegia coerulea TaxID=218851 RepID=A0A2G5CPE2_AQUCA|nr:hypothetical protein AQUCO_04200104v1 [Aquilegia coerulea]
MDSGVDANELITEWIHVTEQAWEIGRSTLNRIIGVSIILPVFKLWDALPSNTTILLPLFSLGELSMVVITYNALLSLKIVGERRIAVEKLIGVARNNGAEPGKLSTFLSFPRLHMVELVLHTVLGMMFLFIIYNSLDA